MTDERPTDPEPDEAAEPSAQAEPAGGEEAPRKRKLRKTPRAKQREPAADAEPAEGPVAEAERAEETAAQAEPAEQPEPAAEKPDPPAKRRAAKATAGEEAAGEAPTPAPAPRRKPGPRRRVVRARARYVRTPARKARIVSAHLPGMSVAQARAILGFTPREVARDWSKLLESAVANAENNHELLEEDLVIREAYADEGPTIKRFRPRAMGRATPIRKRTSHLTITLAARPEQTSKASKQSKRAK
jgi:large subunit ribosomal protein L22